METIRSMEEFTAAVENNRAVLAYFSTDRCSVCHLLKPKVEQLIAREFPQIKVLHIPLDQQSEVAAQNRIFTGPIILVFFEGRETVKAILLVWRN